MRNFFGLFIFCIWATFARYYYVCEIKNHCNPEPEKTTLTLFSEDEVILENYGEFHFNKNSINPILTTNNNLFLDKTASWLVRHPEKNLNITGVFAGNEAGERRGMYENLGLARAAVIQDLILKRGVEQERITLDALGIKDNNLPEPIAFLIYDKPKPVEDEAPEETKQVINIE